MSDEQRAFLAAIRAEPENYLHRHVYADWLDEHDMPEEANRQRAFEDADRWLRGFWREHCSEFSYYTGNREWKIVVAYDEFLERAKMIPGACIGTLPWDTPDEVFVERQRFWECVQIVTGVIVEDKDAVPFRCAC